MGKPAGELKGPGRAAVAACALAAFSLPAPSLGGGDDAHGTHGDPWYPYNGKAWSNTTDKAHPICAAGRMQSPIDLPKCKTITDRTAIVFDWKISNVKLSNNGHTVQVTIDGDLNSTTTMRATYKLAQCHWHWGSEHTIGGAQKPLAAHCVHTKNGADGKYGVIGIFYEVTASSNAFLGLISDKLPAEGVEAVSMELNMASLHAGVSAKEYWTYDGSFTTPPCTEAVDWIPMMKMVGISQEQLDKFEKAIGWKEAGGNYRPPQPLFNREVDGCDVEGWYPYKAYSWGSKLPPDDLRRGRSRICISGQMQSPLDLPSCTGQDALTRPAIELSWGVEDVKLQNNGHGVQVSLEGYYPRDGARMLVNGALYQLEQCHWHWGSEHTVGGVQYPLAVHCVHDANVGTKFHRYGVLGIMYTVGGKNDFIESLGALPAKGEDDILLKKLNFDMIHANLNKAQYWTYEGSLTTPPCTEGVDWFPLMDTSTVSQAQLDAMKAAIGFGTEGGNYRPPQPRRGQEVIGCKSYAPWYPYSGATWSTDTEQANELCTLGMKQSPIDLPKCEGAVQREELILRLGIMDSTVKIGSHAVSVHPKGVGRMFKGDTSYSLMQCHFHAPSEHTVGGERKDLTMHCVFVKDDNLDKNHGVFTVFGKIDAERNSMFLRQFEETLSTMTHRRLGATSAPATDSNSAEVAEVADVDFDLAWANLGTSNYWSYDGSFTTPPCTESASWFVLMDEAVLSQTQFNTISHATGWQTEGGNFRPPQALNDREVLGCTKYAPWYPYDAAAWSESVETPGQVCSTGKRQSPVDLPVCAKRETQPTLTVTWTSSAVSLVNNGHTVQLKDDTGSNYFEVGDKKYVLLQCHFHWGSEHTVGEKQQDLVVHCVHKLKSENETEYGVIGIFFTINETAPENAFLAAFDDELPHRPDATLTRRLAAADAPKRTSSFTGPLDFDKLLPRELTKETSQKVHKEGYWSYDGSLTTPPCNEVVKWFVFMDAHDIPQAQFKKFKDAIGTWGGKGNYRPPQNLLARTVSGCEGGDPEPTEEATEKDTNGAPLAGCRVAAAVAAIASAATAVQGGL